MNEINLFILVASILIGFIALLWSKSSGTDIFVKFVLFVVAIWGFFILIQGGIGV